MSYQTPEGKVKKQGREICKRLGLYHFPVNQGGISLAGVPDDVLCVNGCFVHIEYKAHMVWNRQNKTAYRTLPTDLQVKRMEECRKNGGITLVIDDANIDTLEKTLLYIKSGKPMYNFWSVCLWSHSLEDFINYKTKGINPDVTST